MLSRLNGRSLVELFSCFVYVNVKWKTIVNWQDCPGLRLEVRIELIECELQRAMQD